MRLVDLLLTPRQTTTSLHPFGGQAARDGPIWMTQAAVPPPRRSPVHGTNQQMTDNNLPTKTNPRYCHPNDSPVSRQAAQTSSSRSVGALSDLLRSARSPPASGYRNHSGVTPCSQSVTTELSRLLLQQDSIPPEILAPDSDGSQPQDGRTQEGSGGQMRTELVTMDKNLNCTIWKNEGVFRVTSSSSFSSSASLSSFSSSCSSSKSSLCEPIRVPMGRRVSLLSSDGSDLDPRDHILSTMVDSDSHESLSSPLEEMEASRWIDQAASTGYGDWQNLEDGGQDREGYDVFDSYPLFNFNLLGSTLESSDSPFTPLDGNYLFTSDDNVSYGNDSLVAMEPGVMATDAGSKVDAGLKQVSSGCHDYKPYGVNSTAENMIQAQLSISNGAMRHKNNSSDESLFVAPSFSSSVLSCGASDSEPRPTGGGGPPQSEVVKLLLQNRRQWAPPAEKLLPPHGGYRGSRKRTQGSSASETSRAKAPRSSRLVPLPSSERRHSAPSLTRKVTPFVSTASRKLEDDQSSVCLERLITELILLESENAYSGNPTDPSEDLQCSTWATGRREERDLKRPNSIADELFDGLSVVCQTSDADLFSSLELESIYSGECAELLGLQDAQQFNEGIEGFNVVIKTDPEPVESPSPAHSTVWSQECFQFAANGEYSRKTSTASFPNKYDQTQNGMSGKADVEATTLEGVLQSKLFLDSPPNCSESLTAGSECATKTEQAIIDHDYCQTDTLSSSSMDAPNVEPAWLSRRRKYSKCCLNRGGSDYSALKSLLLDSNLPEEVHREAELDRAKSRKNMAEKPVIAEPLRATLRCNGKGTCEDDDDALLGQLSAEGESPLRLLYKNLTALTSGGQVSLKSLFEQLLSSEETSNPVEGVERIADTVDRLSTNSGCADPCQNHPQVVSVEKREESEDAASLASHLDLCNGGDIENVIFFNSFEEFYSSSSRGQDLEESTAELQAEEERSEGSSSSCESSQIPTNIANRWNFKKPRSRYHSLKKGSSRIVGRRDAARTRALRIGQPAVAPPQGCRGARNLKGKPVFLANKTKSVK